MKAECIGCRIVKDVDADYICPECREWEKKHLEEINSDEYILHTSPTYKSKKKSIPNHIRWAVWLRDNFTCKHCGKRTNLSVDHIFPESKGGEATLDNCQTLCMSCNSRKGAK